MLAAISQQKKKNSGKAEMFKEKSSIMPFTLLLIAGFVFSAQAEVSYTIDAQLSVDAYRLDGTTTITIPAADHAGEDLLLFNLLVEEGKTLEITSATLNGRTVTTQLGADAAAIGIPADLRSSDLSIELQFFINEIPDFEGVSLLDDNVRSGRRYCWYPRLITSNLLPNAYEVTFQINGPGTLAHSAPNSDFQQSASGALYMISDPSSRSLALAYSPIFVEQRVLVSGCDLGVFVREGSEAWCDRLLSNLSEVYAYYAEKIDGFAYSRLDIVLAGRDYETGLLTPNLVVIKDEIDAMIQDFGSVFTSNYLRWKSSLELAKSFWGTAVHQEPDAIPWLRDGLALYFAEKYALSAYLGGPAFDNIRQFYLNATSGKSKLDTSLDQSLQAAVSSGIDVERVLSQSKGLWVVGMLQKKMGGGAFNRFVRSLTAQSQKQLSLDDIQQLAESAAGTPLKEFFDSWIRGNATIDYGIRKIQSNGSKSRVLLTNKGTVAPEVTITASADDGSVVEKSVSFSTKERWLDLDSGSRIVRVRVDADGTLPDVNRGDNLLSQGGSERIELLYAVDNKFEIGDVQLTGELKRDGVYNVSEFELTVSNKQDKAAHLGLKLTALFQGGRNRGITRLFIELAAGETRTFRDILKFPSRNKGLAQVTAEYFPVLSKAAYERLNRSSVPALVNYYIFNIQP